MILIELNYYYYILFVSILLTCFILLTYKQNGDVDFDVIDQIFCIHQILEKKWK
jgi:hypothetical protein